MISNSPRVPNFVFLVMESLAAALASLQLAELIIRPVPARILWSFAVASRRVADLALLAEGLQMHRPMLA